MRAKNWALPQTLSMFICLSTFVKLLKQCHRSLRVGSELKGENICC